MLSPILLPLALLSATVSSSPAEFTSPIDERQLSLTPYAPTQVVCPAGNLIRAAKGVNPQEAAWVAQRKKRASASLKTWLGSTGANFPALATNQYPTMALVDGGGGFRGFLISAGVHKAFDNMEKTKTPMSGLFQAMTYETGLSGSAGSVGSYAGNNWPLTSSIASQLWGPALASGVTSPNNGDPTAAVNLAANVASKQAAGFPISIIDAWGRLLSYVTLLGDDQGAATHMSDILNFGGYTSFQKPYPIITAIGVEDPSDGCGLPPKNATQYEFTPHEFGSWESQIGNFMQTKYVGTAMNNGSPLLLNLTCTNGFDNVGWIIGTSSNVFNENCGSIRNNLTNTGDFFSAELYQQVRGLVNDLLGTGIEALYALMPNPFAGLASAPAVADSPMLRLVDGGQTIQVPPIWPLLYRPDVSVLFISDNSADNPTNYPNTGKKINLPDGNQLHNTQKQARAEGVGNRLPVIPPKERFQALNLNKKSTFFGCNEPADSPAVTIVYLPNRDIVFNSDQTASRLQYDAHDFNAMIDNGVHIATNNNDPGFATCVGCATMKRAAQKAGKALPAACGACFKKYCYN